MNTTLNFPRLNVLSNDVDLRRRLFHSRCHSLSSVLEVFSLLIANNPDGMFVWRTAFAVQLGTVCELPGCAFIVLRSHVLFEQLDAAWKKIKNKFTFCSWEKFSSTHPTYLNA